MTILFAWKLPSSFEVVSVIPFQLTQQQDSLIQKFSQKATGLTCICASGAKHLRDKHSLSLHILTKHAGQFYSCPKCDEHFFQKSDLNRHVEQMYREIKTKCSECDRTFANVPNYKAHNNSYYGIFSRSYSDCKIKPSALKLLNRHADRSHVRKYACKICEANFGSKASLDVHMDFAHANYSCSCPVEGCDAKYVHPRGLRAHIVRIHETKFHPETVCKLCGYDSEGLKGNLRRHLNRSLARIIQRKV